ncbi:acyl-CoA dehydrogenase family protein [Tengunoibacter tsumagoiensis]|uniref:Acyl-CoA dehydrogenase n=1 Tax=Tengunoibacter tsumagoiensis TaxID=2014871 RepID=A0A402A9C2_9CHLR|nr:acyl-CoA dehydrogenase family protein [Tengunoibacter tsumagoiensis]GCE15729.1 acyl-CoA dehydrogenase [Tengunoibacter tsumagoiensis]
MSYQIDAKDRELYQQYIDFANDVIVHQAHLWEEEEAIPVDVIKKCAAAGYLGATIPSHYGGQGWNMVQYGLLNEAIGGASVSLSGLLNVHTMFAQTILKWGSEEQKQRWLPLLASGQAIGVFALTEPTAGSDTGGIETQFIRSGEDLLITGTKKWITFGGAADVYLVFGKLEGQSIAAIVERHMPGFTVTPIRHMLGFKASHLAQLDLHECRIPVQNIVGRPGFALSYLAPYALDYGRISVAFAALGLLRASLEICGKHVLQREAFQAPLIEHGTISALMTDLGVDFSAASLLCFDAVRAKDDHLPDATEKIMIAKYFTSRAAARHASNAVQMMGALGCNEAFPLARFYRDAKTMEIIEGSNQIHQFLLGKSFARSQKNSHTAQRIPVDGRVTW